MYNHFIQTFIDAQTAAYRHYSAIAETEKRLFGSGAVAAVRPAGTAQIVAELRRVYETLADRIITKARVEFPAVDGRPPVDRKRLFRLAAFDIERSLQQGVAPDFDRLWHVLETELRGVDVLGGER